MNMFMNNGGATLYVANQASIYSCLTFAEPKNQVNPHWLCSPTFSLHANNPVWTEPLTADFLLQVKHPPPINLLIRDAVIMVTTPGSGPLRRRREGWKKITNMAKMGWWWQKDGAIKSGLKVSIHILLIPQIYQQMTYYEIRELHDRFYTQPV